MPGNLDRIRPDLHRLIKDGERLEIALKVKIYGAKVVIDSQKDKDAIKAYVEKLPDFNVAYEAWYSEAMGVIKQLLPDRLQDFKEHFERPKNRKDITFASYRIQDALQGLRVTRSISDQVIVDDKAAIPHYFQQLSILKAAEKRFETSLFDIRQVVQADFLDGEIEVATELLKSNFIRAAGAICGVALERHLKQVCHDRALKIVKKNAGIADLNELLKHHSIIDVAQWRFISMLADIRNVCSHSKGKEPSKDQVEELIEGAKKILKSIY